MARLFDFLFGCHHKHTSRMFKLAGWANSYTRCLDCGAWRSEKWFDAGVKAK